MWKILVDSHFKPVVSSYVTMVIPQTFSGFICKPSTLLLCIIRLRRVMVSSREKKSSSTEINISLRSFVFHGTHKNVSGTARFSVSKDARMIDRKRNKFDMTRIGALAVTQLRYKKPSFTDYQSQMRIFNSCEIFDAPLLWKPSAWVVSDGFL